MADSLAGIVLAAGAGTRLRPLTRHRPKPLCPVNQVPLVDLAIERVTTVTTSVAVNVHHGRALVEAHLAGRVHLSIEADQPLGTAGALGHLRDWIDGRPVVVVNGDTWAPGGLEQFVAGWDGERCRVLVTAEPFGPASKVAGTLLPWSMVRDLPDRPSGLYELVWVRALDAGLLESKVAAGPVIDCGTPARYLAANLAASGGASVIGRGAVVEGSVERSVVWPGAVVRAHERLFQAIRVGERLTVLVR
jgi:NDP-sugar pyrophosphorylase family protein